MTTTTSDFSKFVVESYIPEIGVGDCAICGHRDLKYLYTIRNPESGEVISPVGSECIRKFLPPKEYDAVEAGRLKLKEILYEKKIRELWVEFWQQTSYRSRDTLHAGAARIYGRYGAGPKWERVLEVGRETRP